MNIVWSSHMHLLEIKRIGEPFARCGKTCIEHTRPDTFGLIYIFFKYCVSETNQVQNFKINSEKLPFTETLIK